MDEVVGHNMPQRGGHSRFDRLRDLASELTGWYRLAEYARGNVIAFGAGVTTPSRLRLGRDVHVQRGSLLHAGGKAWCGFGGHIELADGVRIGPYCVLYGAGGISIGTHSHLGPGVKLMSQSGRHSEARGSSQPDYRFEPIRIGAGVWIGAGAVVLGGATIGDGASVGPNSVVSGNVPAHAVVVGNPARVVFQNPAGEKR